MKGMRVWSFLDQSSHDLRMKVNLIMNHLEEVYVSIGELRYFEIPLHEGHGSDKRTNICNMGTIGKLSRRREVDHVTPETRR